MQKDIANKSKEKHQENFQNNIVTEISRADIFYKAEEYHQKYIQKGNSCGI
jgi:peptide methionine sulfoxide reductase MsrA